MTQQRSNDDIRADLEKYAASGGNPDYAPRLVVDVLPLLARAERAEARLRDAAAIAQAAIRAIPRRTGMPEWNKGSAVAQATGFDIGLACAADAVAAGLSLQEEQE